MMKLEIKSFGGHEISAPVGWQSTPPISLILEPISLIAFELTDVDAMPTINFYAYYLRLGVPYRRLVCVPVNKRHNKGIDFHQLICNHKRGENFYRLAHWRMVAWANRYTSSQKGLLGSVTVCPKFSC